MNIAESLMNDERINERELDLALKALVVDPQYLHFKGIKVVTPIGFYLAREYDLDTVYATPGEVVLEGDWLFLHPTVKDYHEFLFSYLLDKMGPGEVALITPCSKVKPYRDSFMYKKIESIINKYGNDVWRFVMSEPLVIVPRFFDVYFPSAHYDYPPERVAPEEVPIYVDLVRKALEVIATRFERIVYTLPRKHKRIFEMAAEQANLSANYTPYNVYFFPRLKEAIV
ncbi:Queuine tRNA-ribosyltransferase contain PUA domain-like protein [Ignicoccus hospitalis KIN4/I]|uniref:Queuine tRNA-ribosyltransferase contain PUA domain-like protein n=1 Tax=Ignicoccus hospitalis (strain KIN4/I / DSM 18386 / JCM 14125) TaxID=453591 RepID=A8AAZ0_IGNH4|nr:Queuine tRNA-ribosyltransferase contain PUA domain-like protein [Ignicoccus hospitalis KIN4/I]